uniref:Uncharacterized protein n=1 Tax=Amphimedon queenslandica TaxID=400682 RepID=A0A1X7TA29_AMPQE
MASSSSCITDDDDDDEKEANIARTTDLAFRLTVTHAERRGIYFIGSREELYPTAKKLEIVSVDGQDEKELKGFDDMPNLTQFSDQTMIVMKYSLINESIEKIKEEIENIKLLRQTDQELVVQMEARLINQCSELSEKIQELEQAKRETSITLLQQNTIDNTSSETGWAARPSFKQTEEKSFVPSSDINIMEQMYKLIDEFTERNNYNMQSYIRRIQDLEDRTECFVLQLSKNSPFKEQIKLLESLVPKVAQLEEKTGPLVLEIEQIQQHDEFESLICKVDPLVIRVNQLEEQLEILKPKIVHHDNIRSRIKILEMESTKLSTLQTQQFGSIAVQIRSLEVKLRPKNINFLFRN